MKSITIPQANSYGQGGSVDVYLDKLVLHWSGGAKCTPVLSVQLSEIMKAVGEGKELQNRFYSIRTGMNFNKHGEATIPCLFIYVKDPPDDEPDLMLIEIKDLVSAYNFLTGINYDLLVHNLAVSTIAHVIYAKNIVKMALKESLSAK